MIAHAPAKVAVVQDGGRLHYALPVALQKAGMLSRMYTDYYVKRHSPSALAARLFGTLKPHAARKMLARRNAAIPDDKVFTNPWLTFRQNRKRSQFPSDEAFWEAQSAALAKWILQKGFGDADALLGYVRNIHPDLCIAAKARGMKVVVDQIIAPMAIEQAEAQIQLTRFPDWQTPDASAGWRIMDQLERQTWPLADHITCASDYVRQGLISQGLAPERISVLPYPIDCSHLKPINRANRPGPLTVGFVGAVGLRKGAPYFFQVAKKLARPNLRFVMVGGTSLKPETLAQHKGPVELIGPVPRPEVESWLAKFDILLFPSTCEGSAGSIMEALAAGLPIVTTPNSGSVVTDGIQGHIRPYDAVDDLAACIESLATNPAKREDMSRAARARAETFNLDWYSAALKVVFTSKR